MSTLLPCTIDGVPATASILESDVLEIVYGGSSSSSSKGSAAATSMTTGGAGAGAGGKTAPPTPASILLPLVRDPQRYQLAELFGTVDGSVVKITTNDRILQLTAGSPAEARAWQEVLEQRSKASDEAGWEEVPSPGAVQRDLEDAEREQLDAFAAAEAGAEAGAQAQAPGSIASKLGSKDKKKDKKSNFSRQHTIVGRDHHKGTRTFLTLEDNVITIYSDVDSKGLPRGSKGKIKLMDVMAVRIRESMMRIDTCHGTRELTVESPIEAQAWARLVEEGMEQWAQQETSELRARLNLHMALDEAASTTEGSLTHEQLQSSLHTAACTDPNIFSALSQQLAETLASSRLLKLSSVVHVGFMFKLGGAFQNKWERRHFVLHISGVLNYYDRVYDPALQLKPRGTLILASAQGLDWGDQVTGCSLWPENVPPPLRLMLQFSRKTYYLFCPSEDECQQWVEALKEMAGFVEDATGLVPATPLLRGSSGADGSGAAASKFSASRASLLKYDEAGARAGMQLHAPIGFGDGQYQTVVDDEEHEYALADDEEIAAVSAATKASGAPLASTTVPPAASSTKTAPAAAAAAGAGAVGAAKASSVAHAKIPPAPTRVPSSSARLATASPPAADILSTSSSSSSATISPTFQFASKVLTAESTGAASRAEPAALSGAAAATSTSSDSTIPPAKPPRQRPVPLGPKPNMQVRAPNAGTSDQQGGSSSAPASRPESPSLVPADERAATSVQDMIKAMAASSASSAQRPSIAGSLSPRPLQRSSFAQEGKLSSSLSSSTSALADKNNVGSAPSSTTASSAAAAAAAAATKPITKTGTIATTSTTSSAPSASTNVSSTNAAPTAGAASSNAAGPTTFSVQGQGAASAGGGGGIPISPANLARKSRKTSPVRPYPPAGTSLAAAAAKSPTGGKSVRRPNAGKGKGQPIPTATPVVAPSDESQAFQAFLDAEDLPAMQENITKVCTTLGIRADDDGFYDRLKALLMPKLNFKQRSIFNIIEKRRKMLAAYNRCADLEVLCVGAGPVGLRTAVEMSLLGAQVTVLEKRERFSRFNILHIWDWIQDDLMTLGATGADLHGKSFVHIGTRNLQILLARIALVLGVNILTGLEACRVDPPNEESGRYWIVTARDNNGEFKAYPTNALFLAGGSSDILRSQLGFELDSVGTGAAIGLVAHMKNAGTAAERNMEEFSMSRQFFMDLFGKLASQGMELENVVYYQGDTHYYVMTPKKESLLAYGVLRQNLPTPADLSRENVDTEKLKAFARAVADYFRLPPHVQYVTEGAAVQLFDFSSRKAAKTSCQVLSDPSGHQLAVMLVGDAVLEPFWPEGLGINRGFHTAFDAMWVLQEYFSTGETKEVEKMKRAREQLFGIIKVLSAHVKANIVMENTKAYSLNPATRYKAWKAPK